jgi:hypothetical protein
VEKKRVKTMTRYRVEIELMPIAYELEGENEDKAKEYAEECFFDEALYDLLKHASYKIVEVE